MALLPAERRILDKIEDSLRHSDPQLARMLKRFAIPIWRGGLVVLVRGPRRLRLLIASVFGLAAVVLIVLASLHGSATIVPCNASRGPAQSTATLKTSSCSTALRPKAGPASTSPVSPAG